MATVNDTLRDLEIRHQVGVQRLSSSTLSKLIQILDKADADVVAKLMARSATLQGSFASTRLQQLLDAVRTINRDAANQLQSSIKTEMGQIARYEVAFQKQLIESVLPIKWDMVTPTVQTLNAVVNSRPFLGRLLKDWVADLDAGRTKRLGDAIKMGVLQGETVQQIMTRIRGTKALGYKDGIMQIGRRGAEALVRTAVAHTTTQARNALYDENKDLIDKEQWVSTLDTRTCSQCAGLDGKTFAVGEGTMTPAHIACRCIRVPVVKSWRDLGINMDEAPPGTRASMDGQVSATENYQSWLQKQDAATQDAALGKARADLFRNGMPVESFTNTAGNELTLKQLSQLEGVNLPVIPDERIWSGGLDAYKGEMLNQINADVASDAANAVKAYRRDSRGVNGFLRGLETSSSDAARFASLSARLDSAMVPTAQDYEVWRGEPGNGTRFPTSFDDAKSMIGFTYTDAGYVSTGFSSNPRWAGDSGVMIRMHVPKGIPATMPDAYYKGFSSKFQTFTDFRGENELMLGRDQKYRVIGVSLTKSLSGAPIVQYDVELLA